MEINIVSVSDHPNQRRSSIFCEGEDYFDACKELDNAKTHKYPLISFTTLVLMDDKTIEISQEYYKLNSSNERYDKLSEHIVELTNSEAKSLCKLLTE